MTVPAKISMNWRWAKRILSSLAITFVVACLGGAVRVYQVQHREVIEATSIPLQIRVGVGALGRLEPGWKVIQVAPAASADGKKVESLLIEEGDEIQSGHVIAILDTHSRKKAALEEAQAQVRISQAKLAQVKAGSKKEDIAAQAAFVEQLKASLRKAEAEFRRVQNLRPTGAVSAEEYDQKQFQIQIAQATLRQAESTWAAMKMVRPEDVQLAEAELEKSVSGVALAETDLETSTVRAPMTGRVLKVHTRPGEKVSENGIIEMGDTSAMHAVAEVYEKDVPKLRIGQRSFVRVQSLPGELLGEVVHIGWKVGRRVVLDNDPVKDTDARVVEVRIKLDADSSAKVAGLSYARVDVRIENASGD